MHKINVPSRPVISMIDSPQFGLAKFLDSVIKPCIPGNYMLASTHEFTRKLTNSPLSDSYNMVSFDIVSLFTNVPREDVIDLACHYVYESDQVCKPRFDRKHFRKLLSMATSGEFLYKEQLYRQVDGVAMGSPLGPTLANLFLAHLENEWLALPRNKHVPLVYFRYVDDIFCIFDKSTQNHEEFLKFLNSRHPNLKFTCEIGPDSLSFLDVTVNIENSIPSFSIFRKQTYTGLLMNFASVCPRMWKRCNFGFF